MFKVLRNGVLAALIGVLSSSVCMASDMGIASGGTGLVSIPAVDTSLLAPSDATYITQTADGDLSAEQALSTLSSGIMRVETTTGTITALTDSDGIAANVSDETGTGFLVFSATPILTGLTLNTPTVTLSQDTNFVTSGGVNGMSIDGTTFSVDGTNNRVGIGTASPGAKLDVAGNIRAYAGTNNMIGVYSTDSSPQFALGNGSGTTHWLIYETTGAAGEQANLNIYDATVAANRMTINTSGNVGIGTTTFDGTAAGVLAMGNGTAPAAGTANQSYIYAKDVTASSEMHVMDEAGNETLLSPHAKDAPLWLYDMPAGEENVSRIANYFVGEIHFVNEDRRNRYIEMMINGETLPAEKRFKITETFAEYNARTGESLQVSDWSVAQAENVAERKEKLITEAMQEEVETVEAEVYVEEIEKVEEEIEVSLSEATVDEMVDIDIENEITKEDAFESVAISEMVPTGNVTVRYELQGDEVVEVEVPEMEEVLTEELRVQMKSDVRFSVEDGKFYQKGKGSKAVKKVKNGYTEKDGKYYTRTMVDNVVQKLKPECRIDEVTGKVYRKKTRQEAVAVIPVVEAKVPPKWMQDKGVKLQAVILEK